MHPHRAPKQINVVNKDQTVYDLVHEKGVPCLWDIGRVPIYGHAQTQLGDNDGNACANRYPGEDICYSTGVALKSVSFRNAHIMGFGSTYKQAAPFRRSQYRHPVVLSTSLAESGLPKQSVVRKNLRLDTRSPTPPVRWHKHRLEHT